MKTFLAGFLFLALSGCTSTDISNWVGSWNAAASESEICPSGNHTTDLTGTLTIAAGTAADTIVTQPPNGCDLTWTVSGTGATLVTNQTCTVPGSVGGTWHATFVNGGLTLNGNQIVLGDDGTAVYDNGTQQNCTFTQVGTFTRN
jgi:hypothetical protein